MQGNGAMAGAFEGVGAMGRLAMARMKMVDRLERGPIGPHEMEMHALMRSQICSVLPLVREWTRKLVQSGLGVVWLWRKHFLSFQVLEDGARNGPGFDLGVVGIEEPRFILALLDAGGKKDDLDFQEALAQGNLKGRLAAWLSGELSKRIAPELTEVGGVSAEPLYALDKGWSAQANAALAAIRERKDAESHREFVKMSELDRYDAMMERRLDVLPLVWEYASMLVECGYGVEFSTLAFSLSFDFFSTVKHIPDLGYTRFDLRYQDGFEFVYQGPWFGESITPMDEAMEQPVAFAALIERALARGVFETVFSADFRVLVEAAKTIADDGGADRASAG